MIPVLGSPTPAPPPPQWYSPPPLPKPNLSLRTLLAREGPKTVICREDRVPKTPRPVSQYNFLRHENHMRPPKPSTVTRIASQTRPILVTVDISQSKTTQHEGLKQGNCHEDGVPDRPDPCDSSPIATLWLLLPKRQLSRR